MLTLPVSESLISAEFRSDCSVACSNTSPLCSVSKRSYEFEKKMYSEIHQHNTLKWHTTTFYWPQKQMRDQYFCYQIWEKNTISLKTTWLVINLDAHTAHVICLHLKSTILGLVILIQPNSLPVRSKKKALYTEKIF